MHGAVERLARKRLLVNPAVLAAIEETADPCLQLVDDLGGVRNQRPGQILVVQEPAAVQRVAEVEIEGVTRIAHGVEAALYHAGAAGAAYGALADDDDVQVGTRRAGVQRAHETSSTRPHDGDVAGDGLQGRKLATHTLPPTFALDWGSQV